MSPLRQRLQRFKDSMATVRARRDVAQSRADAADRAVAAKRYEAELNQRSSEVFKKWLEDLLESNVGSMGELTTTALRHVIDDQELRFAIKQELKYNRLSMRFVLEENGVEADPMESFGGGAVHISSLILRIAVMTRLKMANLIVLDESLNGLAPKYHPAMVDFLKGLSEQTGINILLVTHQDDFLANAHNSYEAYTTVGKDGLKALSLRRRAVR